MRPERFYAAANQIIVEETGQMEARSPLARLRLEVSGKKDRRQDKGQKQDQALIQIQDDGRGISPEILARLGQKGETGLDLAEELGLGEKTILVTSRYEEPKILERCLRLKVRMIPKTLAAYVPIDIELKSVVAQNLSHRCSDTLLRGTQRDLDAILIDDDALLRKTWEIAAKQAGKKLAVFSSPRDFLNESRHFPLETPLYIDSHLGDGLKGEEESKRFYEMGYRNIFLATGSEPESFPPMDWINQIVGKEAPWT